MATCGTLRLCPRLVLGSTTNFAEFELERLLCFSCEEGQLSKRESQLPFKPAIARRFIEALAIGRRGNLIRMAEQR